MRKVTIQEIADKVGVSTMTVTRALRNLSGISITRKKQIQKIANELGYMDPHTKPITANKRLTKNSACAEGGSNETTTSHQPNHRATHRYSICVVVPSRPHYFWDKALQGILDVDVQNEQFTFTVIFYSDYSDEEDVYNCLWQAETILDGIDAYIIVPNNMATVCSCIRRLAKDKPVFLLNEWVDAGAMAFVGSDPKQDGRLLARMWKKHFTGYNRILTLHTNEHYMVRVRNSAFFGELERSGADYHIVGKIENSDTPPIRMTSHLAQSMSQYVHAKAFNCLYVSQGFIPQACSALQRIRLPDKAVCIGYEQNKNNEKHIKNGLLGMVLSQDIYGQGRLCMEKLRDYLECGRPPEEHFFYVPSQIWVNL